MKKDKIIKQFFLICIVFLFIIYLLLDKKLSDLNNNDNLLSYNYEEITNNSEGFNSLKIECSNGVTARFDIKSETLIIDDMQQTSSKCEIKINDSSDLYSRGISDLSKVELNNISEDLDNVENTIITDNIYSVGSIYMTISDLNEQDIGNMFGGTWVKYSQGTTLIGASDEYLVNETGGNKEITLTKENLPIINFSGITSSTGSGYSFSHTYSTRTTSSSGGHTHTLNSGRWLFGYCGANYGTVYNIDSHRGLTWYGSPSNTTGNHYHTWTDSYVSTISGVEAHTHKIDLNYTNDAQENINIESEYVVVNIFKRIA